MQEIWKIFLEKIHYLRLNSVNFESFRPPCNKISVHDSKVLNYNRYDNKLLNIFGFGTVIFLKLQTKPHLLLGR